MRSTSSPRHAAAEPEPLWYADSGLQLVHSGHPLVLRAVVTRSFDMSAQLLFLDEFVFVDNKLGLEGIQLFAATLPAVPWLQVLAVCGALRVLAKCVMVKWEHRYKQQNR